MTITQQSRLAGFRAQLGVRGHTLTLQPGGPAFSALLQPATNDKGEYQLAEETTVTDIASILRDELGTTVITPGAILAEGAAQYRVVKVEDHPVDIAVKLHCEAVHL
ncbi:MAG: hypothetical protein KJ072_29025 [Verrucomicrobia bacterium]|nr:hypothetical protein [Verrucomicrobiota bacterium]